MWRNNDIRIFGFNLAGGFLVSWADRWFTLVLPGGLAGQYLAGLGGWFVAPSCLCRVGLSNILKRREQ